MAHPIPVLCGLSGLADGEVFKLGPAADVLMGRSRECGISFQRLRAWLILSDMEQRVRDHFNSAVSRKHLRLTTRGSLLTIENISSTGTTLDGEPLIGSRTVDLAQAPVVLRLGTAPESFRAELMDEAEADRLIAALPVVAEPTRRVGVPEPVEAPTPLGNPTLPPTSRGPG
jgi:hypothetical protein